MPLTSPWRLSQRIPGRAAETVRMSPMFFPCFRRPSLRFLHKVLGTCGLSWLMESVQEQWFLTISLLEHTGCQPRLQQSRLLFLECVLDMAPPPPRQNTHKRESARGYIVGMTEESAACRAGQGVPVPPCLGSSYSVYLRLLGSRCLLLFLGSGSLRPLLL